MQENSQIPVKSIANQSGQSLLVHSIFYTLQGEGPFAGCPAVFVRLGGCNLQCPGCDTEYTQGTNWLEAGELLEAVEKASETCQLIVITGGEPFRQNLSIFVRTAVAMGYRVQIETNGTLPQSDGLPDYGVTIVCSPKTGRINKQLLPRIDAWKYVARASDLMDDGLPVSALGHSASPYLARPVGTKPIYLQPMDEQDPIKNKANIQAVVKSCLAHGYRLCLQMHKIVEVE